MYLSQPGVYETLDLILLVKYTYFSEPFPVLAGVYLFRKTGFKTHQISIEVDNFNQFKICDISLYIAWPGMKVLYGTS